MRFRPIRTEDRELIEAARETLRASYRKGRTTVAAVVRATSGRLYPGVCLDGTPHSPCAEWVALGSAIAANDRDIRAIVAVTKRGRQYPVLSPCGACRQLLFDYAPDAMVILVDGGRVVKARARDLLPGPYRGR